MISLVFWETGPLVWQLYQNQYNFPEGGYVSFHDWVENSCSNRILQCPVGLDVRRRTDNLNVTWPQTSRPKLDPIPSVGDTVRRGAYIRETGKDGVERIIEPIIRQKSSLRKRSVPFIPGKLFFAFFLEMMNTTQGICFVRRLGIKSVPQMVETRQISTLTTTVRHFCTCRIGSGWTIVLFRLNQYLPRLSKMRLKDVARYF